MWARNGTSGRLTDRAGRGRIETLIESLETTRIATRPCRCAYVAAGTKCLNQNDIPHRIRLNARLCIREPIIGQHIWRKFRCSLGFAGRRCIPIWVHVGHSQPKKNSDRYLKSHRPCPAPRLARDARCIMLESASKPNEGTIWQRSAGCWAGRKLAILYD